MKISETRFSGLYIIEPTVLIDKRGFFMETYKQKEFIDLGITQQFVQDNQSHSKKNVLRGLHFQKPPFAQSKLVRVLYGKILDVVVDLRQAEKTYQHYFAIELSAENHKQLFIPKGFAHGFLALTDAGVFYKTDAFYDAKSDAGIHPFDETINIQWPVEKASMILSDKDLNLPFLNTISPVF